MLFLEKSTKLLAQRKNSTNCVTFKLNPRLLFSAPGLLINVNLWFSVKMLNRHSSFKPDF